MQKLPNRRASSWNRRRRAAARGCESRCSVVKWIRTIGSAKAHAVLSKMNRTICNIPVTKAVAIVSPQTTEQCGSCDFAWREMGLDSRVVRVRVNALYTPRFCFEDWEEQS